MSHNPTCFRDTSGGDGGQFRAYYTVPEVPEITIQVEVPKADTWAQAVEKAHETAMRILRPIPDAPAVVLHRCRPIGAFGSEFAVPGDQVRFLNKHGYDHDRERAIKAGLKEGDWYNVADVAIGDWESSYTLEGIEGRFNSAMFEEGLG